MERISKRVEGWDDIYSECSHTPKGDHGIHGVHVHHAVATEASDGRRVVLEFQASTNDYPATIPDAHFRGDKGARVRPHGLTLHCQPLAGLDGVEKCLWHTGLCRVMWNTGIGADTLFKAHGDPTNPYEQPEKFWQALEDKLTELLVKKEHIDKETELTVDHIIAALGNHPHLRSSIPPLLQRRMHVEPMGRMALWTFEWGKYRWSGAEIVEVVRKAYVELFRS